MSRRFGAVQAADVYVGGVLAGTIERGKGGAIFRYAPDYLAGDGPSVALSLPRRVEPYEAPGESLHAFFANLLPEGTRLSALVRAVKTSKDDFLSMLVVVGADTIGDVSVVASGEPPKDVTPVVDVDATRELSFAELFRESLAYDPSRAHEESALPGVQPKLSASHATFTVRARRRGAYILKLSTPEFPHVVENEHFFLRAAQSAGIEAAESRIVEDRDGAKALLVTRFDRVTADGTARKLHQEDGCQLLGRYPADKYAVSWRDLATALADVADAPLVQIERLIRWYAYSYVIGNGDLHAKNVAVRRSATDDALRLTPAYDLVSTLPYGDERMALKLEGRDKNLARKTFRAFGARFGLREPVVNATLDEVCDGVAGWIGELEEIGLTTRVTQALRTAVGKRRDGLR